MAADSDGSGENLTTVVTCEGDLHDPEFPAKFDQILDKLRTLLCDTEVRHRLCVRKLEPWNSVRVTLAIPREAALRLRQLASEGSQQLRALGILSVQVEGDQVISLRLATRFGQEPQEIVLRSEMQDVPGTSSQAQVGDGAAVVSGLTRILSGAAQASNHVLPSSHQIPSTSSTADPSPTTDKVQFRSPNVVCPTDTQVPKVPAAVQSSTSVSGSAQRNYNGPFPFASMTHAAQAIHSRENQTMVGPGPATAGSSGSSSAAPPYNQPPPPYPSQPGLVKVPLSANSPNVALSSPLLVNLLQNDGAAQVQTKMLPPASDQRVKPLLKSTNRTEEHPTAAAPDLSPLVDSGVVVSNGSAFVQTSSAVNAVTTNTSAIKYPTHLMSGTFSAPQINNAVPTPASNSVMMQPHLGPGTLQQNSATQVVGGVGSRLAGPSRVPHQQPFIQKVNTQVPVRPAVQVQPGAQTNSVPSQNTQVRAVRPPLSNQKYPQVVTGNVQYNSQYPRPGFRPQPGQFGMQQPTAGQPQQAQQFQQNFQQFPSPPPYPRQRMETLRPAFQEIMRYPQQQQQQRMPPASWQQGQYSGIEPGITPIASQSISNINAINQLGPNIQPIAQPMPHLGNLNPIIENTLLNISPSLTDLSKTDLDSLLPGSEPDEVTPETLDMPEALTSTGKRRLFLINPLTGVLEPMPSESSGSESEAEDGKETNDIFNDLNSPLNDRSNSIYSDDDTCSTTISRKFDTTDQSDSEATVRSSNSENSVKSHQRLKSAKNRDRNRDSPSLKKGIKDVVPEKIKLRLKLEKSEPVNPAYKVDISFINTQQPKRATQNVTRPVIPASPAGPSCPTSEELRVPPLHISLRGRNSVVINSEKKKKYPKLNPDGTIAEMKKSKKTVDGLKVKKSFSAKELSLKNSSLLSSALSKSESAIHQKAMPLKSGEQLMATPSLLDQKHPIDTRNIEAPIRSELKPMKPLKSTEMDDLSVNCRTREPGEILPSFKSSKLLGTDLKKSKKSNKLNHVDLYREQNLLTGGHLVDEHKAGKKPRADDKGLQGSRTVHKLSDHSKLNSHFKKDKLKERMTKERLFTGHIGEVRRTHDADSVKGLKRHADTNGLLHLEKKRRLSQSEGKSGVSTITESQGALKSVKLKSPDESHGAGVSQGTSVLHQAIVGSTNVGTISSLGNKSMLKSIDKVQKSITKVRRDKVPLVKTKDGSLKSKDLNRDKTYSQNVAEKLAKQLPLPIGEIDMEAKFKQSLLESPEVSRRHLQVDRKFENKLDGQKCDSQTQQDRVTDIVQMTERESHRDTSVKVKEFPDRQTPVEPVVVDTRQDCKSIDDSTGKCVKEMTNSHDRKLTETELPQSQRLDDKQSGRSPNGGGQGEDSGIESMDALSEKSPNQASQSPHSHTDITLTDSAGMSDMKPVKNESKMDLPDLMDIEAQLAKMDGLPTLNGDISHMIKTEPFMKTEALLEKLEGKDLNENKEHVKEATLDECCSSAASTDPKVQMDCMLNISDLPLNVAMQESLKQGNITVIPRSKMTEPSELDTHNHKPDLEISLIPSCKYKCDDVKATTPNDNTPPEPSIKITKVPEMKDLDFDPLPIRLKPPLYTYSNPEKQSRDSESPIPNLSDLEYDNSDSNSECSELKSKSHQKAVANTRRRKQNLDNIQINHSELETCIEDINPDHFLTDLTGFKKNDVVKKGPKSLLEALLIEIPNEIPDKQVSSTSPSVSEKSLNASKSSIRTRSSSKLNSPDISESSKSEKSLKTPKHSPVTVKQDSPVNSPVLCPKTSPKSMKTLGVPVKRKRQESESSTHSNVSMDDANVTRNKKIRKCSENAVELIKACMGVDNAEAKNIPVKPVLKDGKKMEKNKMNNAGLLRKTPLVELESSDSDEPLIEIAGKVRSKHAATRNKLTSTKTNVASPMRTTVSVVGKMKTGEEKVGIRRSVRNNTSVNVPLKTRSKLVDKMVETLTEGDAQMRRKTRSAVSEDVKRRRNSRDGK